MFPPLSPACFQLPFYNYCRFFSIDITPSRLPIARTEKFRATQQSVRFFYWLLSCFRHPKRVLPLHLFIFLLPLFLFIFTWKTTKDNGTMWIRILWSRVVQKKREMREIILVVISVRGEDTLIIENILAAVWSIRKRGSLSLGRSLIHAWLRTATLAQIYGPIKVRCCGSSDDSLNCRVLIWLVVHRHFNYWSPDNNIDLNQKD